jgi:hypothetical protein
MRESKVKVHMSDAVAVIQKKARWKTSGREG